MVWGTGDHVPFCEELPNGADAVCGVQRVATPVVRGMDVGRWVANDPIIALTNPTGLHRLWTLRCQKAVQQMEVGTLSVVMALWVTFFTEARAWFINTQQTKAAQKSERLFNMVLAA